MKAKLAFKLPLYIGLYCSNLLASIVPRNTHKWCLGSHWHRYKDNPKFLMIEIHDSHPEIRAIWISHNKKDVDVIRSQGFESYYWLSVKGLYHSLTAGVYVSDNYVVDVNSFLAGGALFLGLHHGIGLKKTVWNNKRRFSKEFGIPEDKLETSLLFKIATYHYLYRMPNLWLATSEAHAKDIICPMHKVGINDCVLANFPRNNLLLMSKEQIKQMAEKYEPRATVDFIESIGKYQKVYIYMPTWRSDGHDFVKSSQIDFQRLNEAMIKTGSLFIFNLHPSTHLDYSSLKGFSNIVLFNKSIDVYYILPFTDCLIVDYSSVYTDYLMMNKEIILYPFDYEDYLKNSHELISYDDYYKGQRAYNFDELLSLIDNKVDCHLSSQDYNQLMAYYWGSINQPMDIVEEVNKKLNSLKI